MKRMHKKLIGSLAENGYHNGSILFKIKSSPSRTHCGRKNCDFEGYSLWGNIKNPLKWLWFIKKSISTTFWFHSDLEKGNKILYSFLIQIWPRFLFCRWQHINWNSIQDHIALKPSEIDAFKWSLLELNASFLIANDVQCKYHDNKPLEISHAKYAFCHRFHLTFRSRNWIVFYF